MPYSHDDFELSKVGSKKSPQRWMQCGFCLHCHLRPVVEFTYSQSQRYRNEDVERSANVFATDAVNFAIEKISLGTELVDNIKHDVIDRLKSVRIILGFPEEISSSRKIEEFYNELKLKGNETYFESCREFHKHHQKLENEPHESWRRKLDEMTFKTEVEYFSNDNYLCESKRFFFMKVL